MSSLGAINLTKHTGVKHTATVIFFHGSGSCGMDMKKWVEIIVKNFTFPHIKIMFPTAPLQPYTPAAGEMSNVWFDRADITPLVPEKLESLQKIEKDVRNLIQKENDAGIPSNRIVVGGFSMGGALAFHTGYRWDRNVAGIFALSSFLADTSVIYDELQSNSTANVPPLLQIHGDIDDLVKLKWGQNTYEKLKNVPSFSGQFHIMERLGHSINIRGMNILKNWLEEQLPE